MKTLSELDQKVLNHVEWERQLRAEIREKHRPETYGVYLKRWWQRLGASYCLHCFWSTLYIYEILGSDLLAVCPKCHSIRVAELRDVGCKRHQRALIEV